MLVDGVPGLGQPVRLRALPVPQRRGAPRAAARGPYFYLAKLESHHEARLWNEVFVHAQVALGIPRGSIRATVLIETILAAFEMDEILYELREHAAGLNAGRWDYLFSGIKKFQTWPELRRSRPRPADDDGAVHAGLHRAARPDLSSARRARDRRDGGVHPEPARPGGHRRGHGQGPRRQGAREPRRLRRDMGRASRPRAAGDRDLRCRARRRAEPEGAPPRGGVGQRRRSCSTCACPAAPSPRPGSGRTSGSRLAYLDSWLRGVGAAAIDNLMEDAATAEISRSQLWHWRTRGVALADGRAFYGGTLRDRSATRSWLGSAGPGRAGWPTPPRCSIDWCSTTTSRSS